VLIPGCETLNLELDYSFIAFDILMMSVIANEDSSLWIKTINQL